MINEYDYKIQIYKQIIALSQSEKEIEHFKTLIEIQKDLKDKS